MTDSTDLDYGLTTAEADRRRARFGLNATPEPPRRGLLLRIGGQLRDPLVMLLLAAMAVTVALRDVTDALVIVIVIVVNTTVGVVQEARADRDRRAAPARGAHRTGSPRRAGPEAQAGTVVVTGRGTGVAVRTGSDSALGRIAALVAAEPLRRTPLQRRLTSLSWLLGLVALALSCLVLVAGLAQGRGFGEMVITAISLTVAAVPESLPAVVTVALAMGAHRMARRSAIVRSLPAVETLGSVTVVAADKTGTLGSATTRRSSRPPPSVRSGLRWEIRWRLPSSWRRAAAGSPGTGDRRTRASRRSRSTRRGAG